MNDHGLCRFALSGAREAAKKARVKIPPFLVTVFDPHSSIADVYGNRKLIWCGQVCCKYEGRAMAIYTMAEAKEDE